MVDIIVVVFVFRGSLDAVRFGVLGLVGSRLVFRVLVAFLGSWERRFFRSLEFAVGVGRFFRFSRFVDCGCY